MKLSIHYLVLFTSLITGATALTYQICVQKYFAILLGAEAVASACAVGGGVAGLSFGYFLLSRHQFNWASRVFIQKLGKIEILVGILIFFFPSVFEGLINFNGNKFFLLIYLFLVTGLMAASIPFLTAALSLEAPQKRSRWHSLIYGLNSIGASLGCLITGLYFIREWGLPLTLQFIAVVQIFIGTIQILLSRFLSSQNNELVKNQTQKPDRIYLVLAFLSGFCFLGLEMLILRLSALSFGAADVTFSLVIAAIILLASIGSLTLKKFSSKSSILKNQIFLLAGLIIVYYTVPYWGIFGAWLKFSLWSFNLNSFTLYLTLLFVGISILLFLPLFFMGRILPLLLSEINQHPRQLPIELSSIYAANGVGGCLGIILIGYFGFNWISLDKLFKIIVLISIVFFVFRINRKINFRFIFYTTLSISCATLLLNEWPKGILSLGLYNQRHFSEEFFKRPKDFYQFLIRQRKIIFEKNDPNAFVSVVDTEGVRSIIIDGKSDGSSAVADMQTTKLLGHLGGWFSRDSGSAAVIGLGLGITADVISSYDSISEVDIFEISATVIQAQSFFKDLNNNLLQNVKVQIQQVDAWQAMIDSKKKYAVIISEPSNIWMNGVSRLYTSEFYLESKKKLTPDGVFIQWLHTYQMSPATFGSVLRTFSQVFPERRLFYFNSDVYFVGGLSSTAEDIWNLADSRWNSEKYKDDFNMLQLKTFSDFTQNEFFFNSNVLGNFFESSVYTDRLSFEAQKDFYIGHGFQMRNLKNEPLFKAAERENWNASLLKVSQEKNLKLRQSGVYNLNKKEILNEQLDILESYPASKRSPPKHLLNGLLNQCRSEIESRVCEMRILKLFYVFGYLDEYQKLFESM